MPLGIKPYIDFVFKKTFGSPENSVALIGLLNAVLEFPDPITSVIIRNPFKIEEFLDAKSVMLDVDAVDVRGHTYNIEMQTSLHQALLPRMCYYACRNYVDQIPKGGHYLDLRDSLTICLLTKSVFPETSQGHHRFQLIDRTSGRELRNSIEVHTLELLKYNTEESRLSGSREIDRWAYYFLHGEEKTAEELRRLLPGESFESAISSLSEISEKTEYKVMYDQREKAEMDYQWAMDSKRAEGKAEGKAEGLAAGALIGKIQSLQNLAGEAEQPIEHFNDWSIESLTAEADRLQQLLRNRNA